jgi:hypothetical protein
VPQEDTNGKHPAGPVTGLAELPCDAHLDTESLAAVLGRSTRTVARSVRRDELPRPFRLNGHNVWLVGTILDHFRALQEAALKAAARQTLRLSRRCT